MWDRGMVRVCLSRVQQLQLQKEVEPRNLGGKGVRMEGTRCSGME